MLKNFVNFAKPSTFQVLRSFLSSRRNFSAAKEDGNYQNQVDFTLLFNNNYVDQFSK